MKPFMGQRTALAWCPVTTVKGDTVSLHPPYPE